MACRSIQRRVHQNTRHHFTMYAQRTTKHLLLSLCCTLLLAATTHAQGFLIGIEAGVGSHTVKFSESYQDAFVQETGVSYINSRRSGLQGGIRLGWQFNRNFSLSASPTIMQKGTRYETAENGTFEFKDKAGVPFMAVGFVKWSEQYTAVQVPLLLTGRLPLFGERFGLTLSAGPSFNFMLSGKGEAVLETQQKTTPLNSYKIKFGDSRTDDFSGFDASVVFAPGMAFDLDEDGAFRLFAEARFDVGLRDMYTQPRKDFLADDGIDILGTRKMRSSLLTVGVSFCPGLAWD